uniref:Deoxyhypusine hydroxylase n=1 Tax=Bartheletia paradoxa TaxID=669517 RepID=A0A2D0XHX8_9BASI|nr:hypothetical protein SPAR01818 [Bartheletia paradoxa]
MDYSKTVSDATIESLGACLHNTSGSVPLHERFRALFTLKAVGDERAINVVAECLQNDPSALLKHELAYVLGQIRNPVALPKLESVLRNVNEDPMVRHEAAEAIGAISDPSSIPILAEFQSNPAEHIAVRETCEIAKAKIEWDNSPEGIAQLKAGKAAPTERETIEAAAKAFGDSADDYEPASSDGNDAPFPTIDPAPPSALSDKPALESTATLRAELLNVKLPLFERYRAMFGLRNAAVQAGMKAGRDGGEEEEKEAVFALAAGFADKSALFRHEIAYVFGQLSTPTSIPSLITVLRDDNEEDMVRHEAAEALGSIATDDVMTALEEFVGDGPRAKTAPQVVRESCEVAIDMAEYERSQELQYANGLSGSTEIEA